MAVPEASGQVEVDSSVPAREFELISRSLPLSVRQSNTSSITSDDIPAECQDECTVLDEFNVSTAAVTQAPLN